MTKWGIILSISAMFAFASCAINSLGSGPGSGGSGIDDDIFVVANQVVKGSLQTLGEGSGSPSPSVFYAPSKSGVKPFITNDLWITNGSFHFSTNFSLLGGSGAIGSDLFLILHSQSVWDTVTTYNTLSECIMLGDLSVSNFRLGTLVKPVNGSVQFTWSNLTNLVYGTAIRSTILQGDLTNGNRSIRFHFEYYRCWNGTNTVTSYSNCTVNGLDWTPSI